MQFRIIGNNQKVAGSGSRPIILFQAPPYDAAAQLGWEPDWLEPIPTHLVQDGFVVASVTHATLTLRKPSAKPRKVSIFTQKCQKVEPHLTEWSGQSNQPLASGVSQGDSTSLANTMSEHTMSPRSDFTPEGSISGLFVLPTVRLEGLKTGPGQLMVPVVADDAELHQSSATTYHQQLPPIQHQSTVLRLLKPKLSPSQPQPRELPVSPATYVWSSSPVVCPLVCEPAPMIMKQGMQDAYCLVVTSTAARMPLELGMESQTDPFQATDISFNDMLQWLEAPGSDCTGLLEGCSPPASPPERRHIARTNAADINPWVTKQACGVTGISSSLIRVRSGDITNMFAYSFVVAAVAGAVYENYSHLRGIAAEHTVEYAAMIHHTRQLTFVLYSFLLILGSLFLLGPSRDAIPKLGLRLAFILGLFFGPASKLLTYLVTAVGVTDSPYVTTVILISALRLVVNGIGVVCCYVKWTIHTWTLGRNVVVFNGVSDIVAVTLYHLQTGGRATHYPPCGGSLEGALLNGAALIMFGLCGTTAARHRFAGWLSYFGKVGSQAEAKTLPTHAARQLSSEHLDSKLLRFAHHPEAHAKAHHLIHASEEANESYIGEYPWAVGSTLCVKES